MSVSAAPLQACVGPGVEVKGQGAGGGYLLEHTQVPEIKPISVGLLTSNLTN